MSLIAYISFAWMYSAFWCERKEDNNIHVNDDERGFLREKKKKKRDQNHNTNLPGSPGLPLAAADVRNPREEEEEETVVVVLLLANRRTTIAVTAAADMFYYRESSSFCEKLFL